MPQLGPMARARWSVLLAGTSRLHTAFSIESIADELCFIVGPAAVTLLATQVHPAAGVVTAAICCLGGTLWFAAQRATEPPVKEVQAQAGPAPGRFLGPQPLVGCAGPGRAGARVPVPRLDVRVGRPVDGGLRRPVRVQAAGGRDPRLLRARQRDRRALVRVAELAGAGLEAARGHPLADRGRGLHVLGDAEPAGAGDRDLPVRADDRAHPDRRLQPARVDRAAGPGDRGDVVARHRHLGRGGARRDRRGVHPRRARAALGVRVRGRLRRHHRRDLPVRPAPPGSGRARRSP